MTLASCLYEGMVRHRRFEPVEHGFRYSIQLLYLDLAELDRVFEGSRLWSAEGRTPASFRRRDHVGPGAEPLSESIGRLVEARLGRRPTGPIRLLTSPRHLGFVFNPVSLYYVFESDAMELDALVAEVTNTPWGERHCYVLDLAGVERGRGGVLTTRSPKVFHVSPFMEMEMSYEWRIGLPSKSLTFSIRNELAARAPAGGRERNAPYFQADLALRRREIEPARLRASFWREPFLSGRILLGIYWQAFRLALRRVRYVPHPERRWPRDLADPALLREAGSEKNPLGEVFRS
ncbi:MAG TPA: DUF1365 domain-containing protein [Myxococcota bacterium]|nr:DUF1365 domain-containing protein [Myxococcota bacterium]